MRIARVRQLLADPHNAIAESALAVGFQSVSQFNRTFHKLVGQSPSEYRATFLARRPTSASATVESRRLASPLNEAGAIAPNDMTGPTALSIVDARVQMQAETRSISEQMRRIPDTRSGRIRR